MSITPPPPPAQPDPASAPGPVGPASAATGSPAPKKSILPLLSLIFAGVAFLFAVIPATSGLAWAFAVTAIVLAIVALVKKAQPRMLAIVAIIIAPIAWLISIIVFVVSLASGIGSAIDRSPGLDGPAPGVSQSAEESPAEEQPSEEPAAAEPAIGETITNNKGVAVTFTSVQCGIATAGPQFLEEKAKGQFCEVRYTVLNGSKEKISLWASDVTGEIGGVSYETNGSVSQFGGEYFTTDLNPGLSTDAVVYIDIPADKALEYVVYVPQWSLFTDDIRVKVG